MSKFVMMMGLPGSGKTTYAKEKFEKAVILSSDDIRAELFGSADVQKDAGRVFETLRRRTLEALKAGRDVVYDATNLAEKERRGVLGWLPRNCQKTVICVIAPLEACYARQNKRDRKVPKFAIDRMVRRFQMPSKSEGWDSVQFVRSGFTATRTLEDFLADNAGIGHDNPHHERNLLDHMLDAETAARAAGEEDIVCKAMRYHDIGKAWTKDFHDAKGNPTDIAHFYNHENAGAYFALCAEDATEELCFLINHHMDVFKTRGDVDLLRKRYGAETAERLVTIHRYDKAFG